MAEQTQKEVEVKWRIRMLSDRQVEIIVGFYDEINITLEMKYLIKLLSDNYVNPERVVRDALRDGLLVADTITMKGDVYLALSQWGEDEWELLYE